MIGIVFTLSLMRLAAVQPQSFAVCELAQVDRAMTGSATCLSCHDGSAGPALTWAPVSTHGVHPVGVSYAAARPAVAIRAMGPLDARVVLPGGRVECVTCHAPQGPGPHQTAVARCELCVGCHEK